MAPRPHILVVNGRKVWQPVFVIGAPHSGADLLGRAIKQSPGFHLTIGQEAVQSVVYAFARSPSIQRGRSDAAATVMRDAFAQAWQVTDHSCLTCSPVCRQAGQVTGPACCVAERDIVRYGDASPDLMYCADVLVDAFTDAKLVQIIRDGRDVVAAMLADPLTLSWFKPGMANVETEFPNPFFGIETEQDLAIWPELSTAGKCAMRWRGSVRAMAKLRSTLSAEQLTTLRYEDVIRHPAVSAAGVSEFVGDTIGPVHVRTGRRHGGRDHGGRDHGGRDHGGREHGGREHGGRDAEPSMWRRVLTRDQISDVESVAGPDLRRVGYGD